MDTATSSSSPADMCQTDEHKAKTMGSASAAPQTPPRVPCIADTCMNHVFYYF